MDMIRRERSRTSFAGQANGLPHRGRRGFSFPLPLERCRLNSIVHQLFLSQAAFRIVGGRFRSVAIAQMKPRSSRAMAVITWFFAFPRPSNRVYRA